MSDTLLVPVWLLVHMHDISDRCETLKCVLQPATVGGIKKQLLQCYLKLTIPLRHGMAQIAASPLPRLSIMGTGSAHNWYQVPVVIPETIFNTQVPKPVTLVCLFLSSA